LCSAVSGYQHLLDRRRISPQIAGVADVDGVSLQTLDSRRGFHSAEIGADGILNIAAGEAVAGGSAALHIDVQVQAAEGSLGVGAGRALYVQHDRRCFGRQIGKHL